VRRFKQWLGLVLSVLILIFSATPGQGQGKEENSASQGTTFKSLAEEAKQKAKKDMKEVKRNIKEAGKELKDSAAGLKDQAGKEAKKTGEALKKTGKGIKGSLKEAWQDLKNFFKRK
jgi:hypothetical protein